CEAVGLAGPPWRPHISRMRRPRKFGSKARRSGRMSPLQRVRGSTSVTGEHYDPRRKTLRVRYIGDAIYDYFDVPPGVYADFHYAPSKGRYVNYEKKPFYPYARVG